MDRYSYRDYASVCLQGGLPPCSAACPLNLNIREIVKKIQLGKFSSAYRHLRDQAIFPAIVCRICHQPCKKSCIRTSVDDSIELRLLERACVDYTDKKKPHKINLPQRTEKIAVIGGGLTGIACAYLLATRKYKVTVYEKSRRIGGQLWDIIPENEFMPEIEAQIKEVDFEILLDQNISSLDDIGADAFLIATGKGGNTFSLSDGYDKQSFGTEKQGVFIAGAVIGADPVVGIGQASVVAHSIEAFLQVGRNDGKASSFIQTESLIEKDMSKYLPRPPVQPQNEYYTKEEAVKEADRCILCDCTECEDCCEFFHYYKKSPKTLATEAVVDLGNTLISSQQSTHRMASCNLCGLCGKVCPQGIDMGKLFYDFRHYKYEDGVYFKRFNDYFLRDMDHANGEGSLIKSPPNGKKASRLFFPGCQIGAGSPLTVLKTYEYLLRKSPDTAIMLHCCGIPSDWAGNSESAKEIVREIRQTWIKFGEPEIILACTSCKKQLSGFFPEEKLTMIYDVIDPGIPEMKAETLSGKTISIFDPCSSRELPETQNNIRRIVNSLGANIEELHYSSEIAQCCGWGGHTAVANPELTNEIIENRANTNENDFIVYCSNCRDNFLTKGKECVHILDVLFGETIDKPATLEQRCENRVFLKNEILKSIFNQDIEDVPNKSKRLLIGDAVQKKMDALYITGEDIEYVIDVCEADKRKIWDPERECFSAHMKKGIFTYWVDYTINNDKYEIKDAYYHRIEIIE